MYLRYQKLTEEGLKAAFRQPTKVLVLAALISVVIVLAAIFGLAQWAEASVLNHGIQHVLIFMAGIGFGTSMLSIYHAKGKDK